MKIINLVLFICAFSFSLPVFPRIVDATASSSYDESRYAPEKAFDESITSRWASADMAPMPQWLEVRLDKPREIDTVILSIPVDVLYADWKDVQLDFSSGEPETFHLDQGTVRARLDFKPRVTTSLRVTILSVYQPRNHVGINEVIPARDPGRKLGDSVIGPYPLALDDLTIRGREVHPCVNVTPSDVERARARVENQPWAEFRLGKILEQADKWLEESDSYWLQYLPEPDACYAYGFTGDPSGGGSFGTWAGARCSWDNPQKVRNAEGRLFPNEEYPDEGTGYVAEDGRIYYFTGIWNAWVTEQWTTRALPALSQAYLLTGDERYARRGILLLDALASIYAESTRGSWDYPSNPPSGRLARPWYQVARTLVIFTGAYDFMYNSPAMEEPSLREGMTRRENIERYMLLDGAQYCYKHSFHGALHNGHADYLRGALAVGCLLDIPEYVAHAVESPFSIYTMLKNNIDRDGRYYESALGYAIHALKLYLTFADPLYNLRSEEYPEGINLYDDPKMQACLFLPDLKVELAGRRPNFGDSAPDTRYKPMPEHPFKVTDYHFLERLYARTTDPEKKDQFARVLSFLAGKDIEAARQKHSSEWLLWHAAELPEFESAEESIELPEGVARKINRSWVAGMKGLAMLRAGDQAALLRFGPSLNHGDPDDLGLHYYGRGYQFNYDIGYGIGSTHVHCGWASSTLSHCLVTVNESNQLQSPGSGGGLLFFGDLPSAKVAQAESKASYSAENVSEYRRTVVLAGDGGYLVDVFDVEGGTQHDYGFGSIEKNLQPFGTGKLEPVKGSLAEGYAWANKIGKDGNINGYPGKPYWNPPPGNGYGFFYDVRRGQPEQSAWGGVWSFARNVPAQFRMHVLTPVNEAIFANGPSLAPVYPQPEASYVLARRKAEDNGPLKSTFLAVYEPYEGTSEPEPVLKSVRRLGTRAVEVHRLDGSVDLILAGDTQADSVYGKVSFEGDFALISGDGQSATGVDCLGCSRLVLAEKSIEKGPGVFEATVEKVNEQDRSVILDRPVPVHLKGLVTVFSSPHYSRTTSYHVLEAGGNRLRLDANTFSLGVGRVQTVLGETSLLSEIPHEYAKVVGGAGSTGFFDGKRLLTESGMETRVRSTGPGPPLELEVEDATIFKQGLRFEYMDLSAGDRVRIALPGVHELN